MQLPPEMSCLLLGSQQSSCVGNQKALGLSFDRDNDHALCIWGKMESEWGEMVTSLAVMPTTEEKM